MSKLPIRVIRVPSAPAADGDPFDALRCACDRFNETLDATTVPADGGRRILDAPGASALSEATRALFNAIAESVPRLAGAGATLVAAWFRSASVAGFPATRWNEMQARCPGADHPRWRAGDVVSKADLDVLESVSKLLRLEPRPVPTLAPASPREDESAYVPAKDVIGDEYAAGYKQLHRILAQHPEIRQRKPSVNRLEVHAGDWNRFKRQRDTALDAPAVEGIIDAFERRKAKERDPHFRSTSQSET